MAARITRAKKKIAAAGIPYAVPGPENLAERLDAVLTVVHLLSTTGAHGAVGRGAGARRPGRARARPRPHAARCCSRTSARSRGCWRCCSSTTRGPRPASMTRAGCCGCSEQDRLSWDAGAIAEADRLVVAALRAGPPGRFTLQAAIAALHAQAPSYEETDWPQLLELYDALLRRLAVTGGGAEPRGGGGDGRRRARRRWRRSRRSSATAAWPSLPLPAVHQGRPAAPAGPPRGGGRGLPGRAGADRERDRARLPQPPPLGRSPLRMTLPGSFAPSSSSVTRIVS